MRFNSLFKLTSLLGLVGYVNCGGYRMSFYGLNNNRPSSSAIPACGLDCDYTTDYYVALNAEEYYESQVRKDNANTATVCDKCVKITYEDKWVVGKIVDKCPGCPNHGLDVSPTIFDVFASRKVGILYMDWEYTDCSLLGKSGTCKDGKCTTSSSSGGSSSGSSGSSGSSRKKTTVKKTTSSKRRTTTISKSSSIVKPTSVIINTKSLLSKTKISTQTNVPSGIVNKPQTKTISPVINNNNNNINNNKISPTTSVGEKSKLEPTQQQTVGQVVSEVGNNNDDDSNKKDYIIPVTGALVVSGAAGVALIYAKRQSTNVNALKEKFPEAFSNIKRSISRGSTAVRQNLTRSLSNSGKAIKRSLSKKGSNGGIGGPHIRTKKKYRESLDAHYPVQLYDPPMPSNAFIAAPNLPYQSNNSGSYHFKSSNNNNNNYYDDGQLQTDFIDTYRYH